MLEHIMITVKREAVFIQAYLVTYPICIKKIKVAELCSLKIELTLGVLASSHSIIYFIVILYSDEAHSVYNN